jgi:phytanoyl-CoA hydroxylase
MKILPAPEVSTENWARKVRIHNERKWTGISPNEVGQRGKQWSQDLSERPWFDQEDAERKAKSWLDQGVISSDEHTLLSQWIRDGYFILEKAIDASEFSLLERYAHDLDGVWTAEEAMQGLRLSGVRVNGKRLGPLDHAELLSWPLELRLKSRDTQTWRIHYYQPYSPAGLALAKSDKILRLCYLLLQDVPVLLNLTAYKYSSEVGVHQDMYFYHVHPVNYVVGVWAACEDVRQETGPLVVYPGSHRFPLWPGFNNYPQTNYRTCHRETHIKFENHLCDSVSESNRLAVPVKKGDVIFLNGLLVHGADKAEERGAQSRFSFVLHYTIPGANKIDEVEGPFNF